MIYRNFIMCCLALLHDRLNNAIYRGLEKLCNLGTVYHVSLSNCTLDKRVGISYPASFICPKRMSDISSLSRAPPNLMYCGSLTFLNLGFVVLSKQVAMWSTSSANFDSDKNSVRALILKIQRKRRWNDLLLRYSFALKVTKTDPWK